MTPSIVTAALQPDTPHVPVAIVGAGACGMSAALMLHDAGVDCVLLERDPAPCGSTALSSGFIPAAGTRVQQALGIEDSPESFAADIQAKAHGTAAAHLVSAYTQAIGLAIDALQLRHGIDFVVIDGFLYPGHSRLRMHAVPEKTGVGLMTRLQKAANSAGIPVITSALVRELCIANGAGAPKVLGVGYERPDGRLEQLSCDVLILACNGFGGNAAMVRDLLPAMRDACFAGHSGNDGTALAWGKALGAQLADLGGYQGHGSWAVPQGALISWALMTEGGVQINAAGQRFHDESQGYSEASVKVLAQPGKVVWNVFDAPLLALAGGFPDFCEAQAAGAVKTCADTAALATLIGCELEALNRTLASISAGSVNADGRIFQRALQAPYCAVKVTGALFHTQGGLAVDAHCRVLQEDGSPLPNLLAAGGAARGVSGNAVWGYLSGNGLLSAVAGGYIAAQTASLLLEDTLPS
jgi:fumarate reductase flavoprotein subunit